MSNRAITAVLDYSKTKGSTRLLMLIIADGISKDTGLYIAEVATLCWQTNCHRRNLQYLIRKALQKGELIIFERDGHASGFAIPIFDGETGYKPEQCHDESHICLGTHTPLEVSREEAKRQEIRQHRARRKVTRAEDCTPDEKTAEGVQDIAQGGAEDCTPVRNAVHPGAQRSAPITRSYPSITPVVPTRTTPHDENISPETDPAPGGFSLNKWATLTADRAAAAWLEAHGYNAHTWSYPAMLRAYDAYWQAHNE